MTRKTILTDHPYGIFDYYSIFFSGLASLKLFTSTGYQQFMPTAFYDMPFNR